LLNSSDFSSASTANSTPLGTLSKLIFPNVLVLTSAIFIDFFAIFADSSLSAAIFSLFSLTNLLYLYVAVNSYDKNP